MGARPSFREWAVFTHAQEPLLKDYARVSSRTMDSNLFFSALITGSKPLALARIRSFFPARAALNQSRRSVSVLYAPQAVPLIALLVSATNSSSSNSTLFSHLVKAPF